MSDIPASDKDPVPQPETTAAAAASAEATAAGAANGAAEALAKAQADVADLKDKLLRTLADMENLRRRTEKEVADARTYGVSKFAGDILGVADNIRRALEALPAGSLPEDGPLKALVEGIELTERDLAQKLERHGVRKIDPKGEKFDPHLHQAMFEAPNPAVPNGHVMEVVQVGYTIGERVLRPALVGIARGGPKGDAAKTDAVAPRSSDPSAAAGTA